MKITLVQCKPKLGAIQANTDMIIEQIKHDSTVLVFPELVLTGYPPDDLLYDPNLPQQIEQALSTISMHVLPGTYLFVGCPHWKEGKCYNACAIIQGPEQIDFYFKQKLPCYGVFTEPRHFSPGLHNKIITIQDKRCLILICEDLWEQPNSDEAIDFIICLNASPYTHNKMDQRLSRAKIYAEHYQAVVCYCNYIGGQDELVFDGQSFIFHPKDHLVALAPCAHTALIDTCNPTMHPKPFTSSHPVAMTHELIKLSIHDYMQNNHLKHVVVGLSGGIDSALCLALLAECLPSEFIHAYYLPSPYSSDLSESLANEQCQMLGIKLETINISPLIKAYEHHLGQTIPVTNTLVHQNIQARIRANILMAAANEHQALLIATSNKSEAAMGYTTLYGDMAGGFAPLKDCFKTEVYELANDCNHHAITIPQGVIDREPTAELAENQLDSDTLPEYATLDLILSKALGYQSLTSLSVDNNLPQKLINEVLKRLHQNEHKRFQMPPGPTLSETAFGRNRHWPITVTRDP